MFVVSIKSSRLKTVALSAVAVLLAVAAIIAGVSYMKSKPASNGDGINLRAATAQERVSFLSQFGWSINEDPVEVAEVLIPAEFDDTYTQYNELQKTQNNLDLTKYAGRRAKRWTYEINNYPGYENGGGLIRANLLIYEGMVIGGDVCSIELNGFMQGFAFPQQQSAS